MRIILNIGHGGLGKNYDSGAIAADGTHEHSFNRDELAPLLIRELEARGHAVTVIIQKASFGELPARINALNPELILSLHFNAYNGKATGSEVLHWRTSRKSKALAENIQKGTVAALGLADRGAKGLAKGRGSELLRRTNAPCVILEPFFGDNPADLARARENLSTLAKAIAASLDE